jgi:hypothetical protein
MRAAISCQRRGILSSGKIGLTIRYMGPANDASAAIEFGRFRVLPRRRQLLADNQPVELGGRVFVMILVLL